MYCNVQHSAARLLRAVHQTLTCARRDGAGFAGLGGFWCFSGAEASASNEGACLGFQCCSWLFTVCTPSAFNVCYSVMVLDTLVQFPGPVAALCHISLCGKGQYLHGLCLQRSFCKASTAHAMSVQRI